MRLTAEREEELRHAQNQSCDCNLDYVDTNCGIFPHQGGVDDLFSEIDALREEMALMPVRAETELKETWLKWASMIPYLTFPPHWQIKIIPPFGGAIVRFGVKTDEMRDGDSISIYLDCLDKLGYMGQPYWEVYPINDGYTYRCTIKETKGLIEAIQKCIDEALK